MLTIPPHGLSEIVRVFGDPRKYVREDGTLDPMWERMNIVRIPLPAPLPLDWDRSTKVRQITSHRLVASRIREALEVVYERGLWQDLDTYAGGFVWRPIRGSANVSTHAFGIAWDFGASRDPLGDPPGGPDPDMPIAIVKIMKAYGFIWGGDFKRPDQMHFQFASGY
jgi:hypothetical protein